MLKVGILASTNGTDLPAIIESNLENVVFSCFITNVADCGAREKAQKYQIPDFFVSHKGKSRKEFDQEVVKILQNNKVELVILVGFMRILSPYFVQSFPHAILNVHPSLLPAFAGGMDTDVHSEVLKTGCKIAGATIHFVTEEVDGGPIAMQDAVKVEYNDTPDSLKKRVQVLEQKMFPEAIRLFRDKKFEFTDGVVKIRP